MWSAACKGVSPSMREIPRGSAPLVKRRKANSKSSFFRQRRRGLSWLSWSPSGKAGREEKRIEPVSYNPGKRYSMAQPRRLGLLLPFRYKGRADADLPEILLSPFSERQKLCSTLRVKALLLQVPCSWVLSHFSSPSFPSTKGHSSH